MIRCALISVSGKTLVHCLLLGIATNVLLAWMCCLIPMVSGNPAAPRLGYAFENGVRGTFLPWDSPQELVMFWARPGYRRIAVRHFGCASLEKQQLFGDFAATMQHPTVDGESMWRSPDKLDRRLRSWLPTRVTDHVSDDVIHVDIACGWPMLAMRCRVAVNARDGRLVEMDDYAIRVAESPQRSDVLPWCRDHFLPLYPMWPGFCENVLIFVVLWFGLYVSWGASRTYWRIRRCRCPSCNYNLLGSVTRNICPECGDASRGYLSTGYTAGDRIAGSK